MSNSIKPSLTVYLAVGIGGMLGSVLRYIISLLFHINISQTLPWATLLVNLSGAFLLAMILFQPTIKGKFNPIVFTGFTTGMLGSFTTFSTIMIDVVSLWQNAQVFAIIYTLVTFIGGIFASFAGYLFARKGNLI